MQNGHKLLEQIHELALRPDGGALSDGQLLELFESDGNQRAFEGLVQRHGGLVWGMCRRMLANRQDAEDAFQATFLVLARKASSIRPREQVGNWLQGVAYRVALKARAESQRRKMRMREMPKEMPVAANPEPDVVELREVLDRELLALPHKYREPIVLCFLKGKSRKEAAETLGWTEGTLSGRLARAKEHLQRRLRRYGYLPAAGIGALLAEYAHAEPPSMVMNQALTQVIAMTQKTNTFDKTTRASRWADAMTRYFWWQRLRRAGVVAALLAVVVGLGYFSWSFASPPDARKTEADVAQEKAETPKQRPDAKKPAPSRIFFWLNGLVSIRPDGGSLQNHKSLPLVNFPRVSPDGKFVAFGDEIPRKNIDNNPATLLQLYVKPVAGNAKANRLNVICDMYAWAHDSKTLVWRRIDFAKAKPEFVSGLVDVQTRKITTFKLPPNHVAVDVSPDHQSLITMYIPLEANSKELMGVYLASIDGNLIRQINEPGQIATAGTFSPDGKRILYSAGSGGIHFGDGFSVYFANRRDGKRTKLSKEKPGSLSSQCWSPDGKQVAHIWQERGEKPGALFPGPNQKKVKTYIKIVDVESGKARIAHSLMAPHGFHGDLQWRTVIEEEKH